MPTRRELTFRREAPELGRVLVGGAHHVAKVHAGLDDALRELIVARAPVRQIKEAARRNGTRFLRDAAVELFLDGLTTLDEINRVTLVA